MPAGQRERAHLWLLLPLTFLCCTLGGLLRVLGPAAAIIGTLLSAGFVVAAELPAPTVVESLRYALFFVAGASWAILMTALVWRRRPGRTPRWPWPIATGDWPILPTRWPACIPACARDWRAGMERRVPVAAATLRAALEAARSRIGEVQGARPSRRTRAQQLYYLLDRAEDSFIAMVAAADLLESNAPRWLGRNAGAHLCHALHRYASVCNAIAGTSDAADARRRIACANGWNATAPICANFAAPRSRTRPSWPASFRCWTGCNSPPSPSGRPCSTPPSCRPARHPARPPARQAWNTLRQNLRLESDALRHALRVGIGATLAVALSRSFAVNHGYWMSLTLVFILQPYFAATARTVERVLGSVAGAIGASLLGLLLSTPLSVALAVLPIALGTFAARTVNYALFTFFLTSQFVLVSHIQQPDLHEPELAALRQQRAGRRAGAADRLSAVAREAPASWPVRWRARCSDADYVLALVREKSGEAAESPRRIVELRRQACGPTMPRRHWNGCSRTLAPRQQGRHGGSPAQCHAPGDRRRHRAGNPARAACRQRSGIRAARLRRNPGAGAAPARRRTGTRRPGHAGAVGGGSGATRSAAPLERIARRARQVQQLRDKLQQA